MLLPTDGSEVYCQLMEVGLLPAAGGGIISMFSWLVQVEPLESDNQDFLPSEASLAASGVSSYLVSFTKRIS